ncbi:MAG: DUF6596 domain-containing protein [Nannocystaceae bacterium]
MNDARAEIAAVVREHHGWVLARLVRTVHDLELAEDALGRALEAALLQWPQTGVPPTPRAWLVRTARNKAIDELRRRAAWALKQREATWLAALDADAASDDDVPIRDDMLRLLFTCCHPALPEAARVALTLQVVVGMQADEIARAFLVPTATMAQRLVRAKRKIKEAGVPYRVPGPDEIEPRAAGVRAVVYLVFNEGYAATRGDAGCVATCATTRSAWAKGAARAAVRRSRDRGLLALMLLHEARHAARQDAAGDVVLLAEQDRSRWDRAQIDRGVALVEATLRSGLPGPWHYALQAAIAAVHATAPSSEATDWPQLVGLYDRLVVLVPTPVVALNRAVAVAFARGVAEGLAEVERLAEALGEYPLFHFDPRRPAAPPRRARGCDAGLPPARCPR